MPAPQDRPRPYDAYAVEYAEWIDPTLVRAAERLSELAGARNGMRLLDLATGTGAVARAAEKRGASVVGVDVSPGMLAVAKDLSPQLDFRYSDARALPFTTASSTPSPAPSRYLTSRLATRSSVRSGGSSAQVADSSPRHGRTEPASPPP